jgi:hypothetical protein
MKRGLSRFCPTSFRRLKGAEHRYPNQLPELPPTLKLLQDPDHGEVGHPAKACRKGT